MGLHASTAAILEQRYRRLLRWYPAAHRDRHGEEMIGVLLAAARPGQHRPGLTESANLLWGGARIWLRRLLSTDSGEAWSAALAALAVLAPLIWTAWRAIAHAGSFLGVEPISHRLPLPLAGRWIPVEPGPLGWLQHASADMVSGLPAVILTVLVLLRLRRTAILWIVLVLALAGPRLLGFTPGGLAVAPNGLGLIALQLVALAALLATRERLPRLAKIDGRAWLLAGVIAVTTGVAANAVQRQLGTREQWHTWQLPVMVAGLALLIALTVIVPGCRRLVLLLAIPVLYGVAYPAEVMLGAWPGPALAYLPLAVLVVLLALVLIRRSRPRTPVTGSAA